MEGQATLPPYFVPRAEHLVGSHPRGSCDTSRLETVRNVVGHYEAGEGNVRHEQWERLNVIVQELVDGHTVCIYFNKPVSDNVTGPPQPPVVQCAFHACLPSTLPSQHHQEDKQDFMAWMYEHQEDLYNVLGPNQYVLFGSWLGGRQHDVHYDRLPAPFLAFDLFETHTGRFLTYDLMTERLGDKFHSVPVLWRSQQPPSTPPAPLAPPGSHFAGLERLIGRNHHILKQRSAIGQEALAGIYVRIEYDGHVPPYHHRYALKRKIEAVERGIKKENKVVLE